jgi:ribosomal protection tetracycline resistance protein
MESVIDVHDPADGARLRVALGELSEQDPLIRVQHDEALNEVSVSLYGEVQKEIIESTLAEDYGIVADFRETTTIYVERPMRTAEAAQLLTSDSNPYMATVGLRVEPGPLDSGVVFALNAEQRLPLYVYKSERSFTDHMAHYIRRGLGRGPYGWEVTDCIVTLTRCDYYVGDGPAKPTVPMARTTSADFRMLTPLVLLQALEQAGTCVCEPMARLSIESPSRNVGDLLQAVVQLGGIVDETRVREGLSTIEATMPAQRSRELQRQLPGLSGGEGNLESSFGGYRPIQGRPPTRPSAARKRSRCRALGA